MRSCRAEPARHDRLDRQSLPHLLRFVFLMMAFLAVPFCFAAVGLEAAFFLAALLDELAALLDEADFLVEPTP